MADFVRHMKAGSQLTERKTLIKNNKLLNSVVTPEEKNYLRNNY